MRLKTKIYETWVDMPDGSRFLVRELPTSKQKELLGRHQNNGAGFVIDAYQYQIRDWQNVCDESGIDAPFSQDTLRAAIETDLDCLNEVMSVFRRKLDAHMEELRGAGRD